MKFFKTAIPLLILFIIFPHPVSGKTIVKDTVWKGELTLSEDIIVPEGVTLTILSGTTINVTPSDRTKSEAEYISYMTEITIRGRLEIEGTKKAPVVFQVKGDKPDRWAGIIIDGGSAYIRSCRIHGAETGVYVLKGSLEISDSVLKRNRYAIIAQGKQALVNMNNIQITKNDYGVFSLAGAKVRLKGGIIAHNMKKDLYLFDETKGLTLKPAPDKSGTQNMIAKHLASCSKSTSEIMREYTTQDKELSKIYGDEVLQGDTVWRGRVLIEGLLRVPENSRLIITPGAVVEFRRKDTDGDGIGENGILMQGVLIAKGTKEEPILFRSAERQRRPGDWDSINIMNSDGAQNLVEFCQIEDAYRGLHFHFSNVMVNASVLRNNYLGIQFQESAVEIKGSRIYGNRSGIKGRDSRVGFTGNYVFGNINGVNFFRTNLNARNNTFLNNMLDGFKIREGMTEAEGNLIACGRSGLMVNDAFHGRFDNNVIVNNFESGMSLRGGDNIEVSGNFIQGNGFNGLNLQDAGAVIKDNFISGNGERGIGIQAFTGAITGNNISGNGLYAVENESGSDIPAPSNWWGGKDAATVIYDKDDETQRGRISYSPIKEETFVFIWPVEDIYADITWHGDILLKNRVNVFDAALDIAPAARVSFSKGAGLKVSGGEILARGKVDERIVFTLAESGKNTPLDPLLIEGKNPPLEKVDAGRFEDASWDEILLEHADGSEFSFCDFEYATWAIHSHFTNLKISNSRFIHNEGGIRFRSGPVEISRSLFKENKVGIRSYFGNALIKENVILDNEVGIFVREKGSGLTIRRNNIYSNRAYNIRAGDFNAEDIDARENWWGENDPAETIFDGRHEPGIGKVIYEPYLKEQVELKGKGKHTP
ncbi:MAG: right-handed parallel beta-helix repeat-containing protein [Nitrospirae bacterium]|nr:right-handed parallel beta-helix repeat-containing protein [Nitrospirota bacterium]